MRCTEIFFSTYNREPVDVAFCPYRVCPIGAHSDHQHGKITGLAIDKGESKFTEKKLTYEYPLVFDRQR